ncbi:hypothetical protein BKP37_18845 [Anaerobacillus alkalilacustris]|uniref:Uroporphyrinogen-III synthase n=1 Tax=Anaerobacillus alkalilacustris TaxID=393763 RepID=A0A1S2LEC7_9BACI|nr:uroporphyrinogen-III synthase [Anaerobacillus alkalilacustris]OIJ10590.1 hypothetical protein BKP37_18845 [Anaerobacillus alkalilacustris]
MELKGKRILVTRAKAQASALSLQIEKYGGIPVEMPLITCKAVKDKTIIHKELRLLHTYQWLIFTSKNGIDFFFEELNLVNGSSNIPPTCKIAVVGEKTENALAPYGLKADLIPELYVAESLVDCLLNVLIEGERVLIPRGNLARDIIPKRLRENEIKVTELDVYETVIETNSKDELYRAIKNQELDVVTFTSSSTVENFVQLLKGSDWRNYLGNIIFASIGPITTKTMKKHHVPVHTEPSEYTINGMLISVMDKLKEEK